MRGFRVVLARLISELPTAHSKPRTGPWWCWLCRPMGHPVAIARWQATSPGRLTPQMRHFQYSALPAVATPPLVSAARSRAPTPPFLSRPASPDPGISHRALMEQYLFSITSIPSSPHTKSCCDCRRRRGAAHCCGISVIFQPHLLYLPSRARARHVQCEVALCVQCSVI